MNVSDRKEHETTKYTTELDRLENIARVNNSIQGLTAWANLAEKPEFVQSHKGDLQAIGAACSRLNETVLTFSTALEVVADALDSLQEIAQAPTAPDAGDGETTARDDSAAPDEDERAEKIDAFEGMSMADAWNLAGNFLLKAANLLEAIHPLVDASTMDTNYNLKDDRKVKAYMRFDKSLFRIVEDIDEIETFCRDRADEYSADDRRRQYIEED